MMSKVFETSAFLVYIANAATVLTLWKAAFLIELTGSVLRIKYPPKSGDQSTIYAI